MQRVLGLCSSGSWRRSGLHTVLLLKPINSALGVEELLLAGVVRVTVRTHTHSDLRDSGAGLKCLSATAAINGRLIIRWMDVIFHSRAKVLQWAGGCQYLGPLEAA